MAPRSILTADASCFFREPWCSQIVEETKFDKQEILNNIERLIMQIESESSSVNVINIGRVPSAVKYLRALRRTLYKTFSGMGLALFLGILAVCGLNEFAKTGTSFLHPYFALFLCLTSGAFIIQAIVASLSIKNRIEKILREQFT